MALPYNCLEFKYLLKDERELLIIEKAKLIIDKQTEYMVSNLTLTNYRLLGNYIEQTRSFYISIESKNVEKIEMNGKFFACSILIMLKDRHSIEVFVEKSRLNKLLETYKNTLLDKKWLLLKDIDQNQKTFGISSIESSRRNKILSNDSIINNGFRDMNHLLEEASKLSETLGSIVEKLSVNPDPSNDNNNLTYIRRSLLSIGIDNPVIKSCCKNDDEYHSNLANEIELFMKPIVQKHGSIEVCEAYCRLNRARKQFLISPKEMYESLKFLNSSPSSSLLLITSYRSNCSFIVSRSQYKDDENSLVECLKIVVDIHFLLIHSFVHSFIHFKLAKEDYVTAQSISQLQQITLSMALQKLIDIENKGIICRDESIEGLMFFLNKF